MINTTQTVQVMTVGEQPFTFEGPSAAQSLAQHKQIDAVASGENGLRTIIPFHAIDYAGTSVQSASAETPEDANCVTRTPEEGGD